MAPCYSYLHLTRGSNANSTSPCCQCHGRGDVTEAGGGHDRDGHGLGDGVGGRQRRGGALDRSLDPTPDGIGRNNVFEG